jgi:hypothetical protein
MSTRKVPISFGIVAPDGTPSSTTSLRVVSISFRDLIAFEFNLSGLAV